MIIYAVFSGVFVVRSELKCDESCGVALQKCPKGVLWPHVMSQALILQSQGRDLAFWMATNAHHYVPNNFGFPEFDFRPSNCKFNVHLYNFISPDKSSSNKSENNKKNISKIISGEHPISIGPWKKVKLIK